MLTGMRYFSKLNVKEKEKKMGTGKEG